MDCGTPSPSLPRRKELRERIAFLKKLILEIDAPSLIAHASQSYLTFDDISHYCDIIRISDEDRRPGRIGCKITGFLLQWTRLDADNRSG